MDDALPRREGLWSEAQAAVALSEAKRLARDGDLDGALHILDEVISLAPAGGATALQACKRAGRLFSEVGGHRRVASRLWGLMERSPDAAPVKAFLGGLGREAQIAAWRALMADHPDDARVRSNLGRLLGDERLLSDVPPNDIATLELLARRSRKSGDPEDEIAAWRRVVEADPGYAVAHTRLFKLYEAASQPQKTIPHLAALAASGHTKSRVRLAQLLCDLGRLGEAEPHLRALAAAGHVKARRRLAQLLCDLGRLGEAETHLRALAEAPDGTIRDWRRLSRCLMELRDDPGATEAWRRVLQFDPKDMEAQDRLDRLGHPAGAAARPRGGKPTEPPLRVTVLGNYQAYALTQCLRGLLPAADVSALVWTELGSVMTDERIAGQLEDRDLILSQYADKPVYGALQTAKLIPRTKRFAMVPNMHFTGFHPDLTQLSSRSDKSVRRHRFGNRHSALTLAAFLRGAPADRAAELFNAYIYGVLGYFDEYAKAEQHHVETARDLGIDLEPELAAWRRQGVFVHVPNHPVIGVFQSMAEMVTRKLGLETRPVEGLPLDRLGRTGGWPVYPEIAQRLGVEGSLRFEAAEDAGAPGDIDALVHELYRVYATADPETLRTPRIAEIEDILKREGV